jgi:heme/copper-type cytochrome/quinol oxidase subunit 3
MTPVYVETPPVTNHAPPPVRRIDDKRGSFGMALFIATETCLFLALFFAYYWTDKMSAQWRSEIPPKLNYSLPMLGILLTSSAVLYWGEQLLKKKRFGAARLALAGTILLGMAFLVLTYFEDMDHLKHLTPRTDSYGSMFYTITTLHAAHVTFGLLMLMWVFIIPRWEPALYTPHRPYHNVAMYWHFVDTVWVFIVALLYVAPNIYNPR